MPDSKPNILVIWGDDIGITNLSCYSDGLMGYRTPNIDRIADEGMRFTDSYGEQSCTAGRSSFITGQSVYRTGMSKVGMPGVDIGLPPEDPTIAELLKPLGYATGQFGKNHLGDLNKYLPTVHGFDEFFGNLYHLNAEEEPENPDYPTAEEAPLLRKALLPRGVIHSWATEEDSDEVDERYGPVGKQRIEDTGPLTKKRMETIDDETTAACVDFIKRQHEADTPFFVWMNMTHMHFRTHTKPESRRPGRPLAVAVPRHDDRPRPQRRPAARPASTNSASPRTPSSSTRTDNGPHANSWPDGATTPFRSEKDTNWEGAFRIPEMIRWPGKIPAGIGVQRDRPAPRLAADVPGGRRRARHRREAQDRATRSATRPTRCTSTATTCCRT